MGPQNDGHYRQVVVRSGLTVLEKEDGTFSTQVLIGEIIIAKLA